MPIGIQRIWGRGEPGELIVCHDKTIRETITLNVVSSSFSSFKGRIATDTNPIEHISTHFNILDTGRTELMFQPSDKIAGIFGSGKGRDLNGKTCDIFCGRGDLIGRLLAFQTGLRNTEHLYLNRCGAGTDDTDLLCRRIREVYNSSLDKGAAVIEANHRFFSIAEVLNFNMNAQRQSLVRRRHGMHIISFAITGFAAMEIPPVPACQPLFRISPAIKKRIITLALHHIRLLPVFQASGFGRINNLAGSAAGRQQKCPEKNTEKSFYRTCLGHVG
jgi:hypothetical protein